MRNRHFLCSHHAVNRGFTLVEAVIVIVITGIVAVGVAIFLRAPVAGYVNSAARADLADTADTALRRMARDIRLALPNSVRVAGPDTNNAYYIELLLTRTGGRYLDLSDVPGYTTPTPHPLDFTGGSTQFDVVGSLPGSLEQKIQVGSDSVVVSNLGQQPSDAYQASPNNRSLITAVSTTSGVTTITMQSDPFTSQVQKSNYFRFQVISGPVTYRCDPTSQTVTRYWNYAISATQPSTLAALSSAQSALIATGVNGCIFTYSQNSMNDALAVLNIQMGVPGNASGSVGLFQQVHVDNTP